MDLVEVLFAGATKLGPVPSWLTLVLALKILGDLKRIKRRLGIVEARQRVPRRHPLPRLQSIPAR